MTEDKFLELVREHQAKVYRHALYLLGNREDAEDITQETFMKAWEHRAKLRPKTVHSWLLKCAQNLCFNLLKRNKFQVHLTDEDDRDPGTELETLMQTRSGRSNPAPDEIVLRQELKATVQCAISKLPPEMRSVIVMRELEGMSFQEIAEVMERPEGTVKSIAFRARKKLRELLRPYWRDDE